MTALKHELNSLQQQREQVRILKSQLASTASVGNMCIYICINICKDSRKSDPQLEPRAICIYMYIYIYIYIYIYTYICICTYTYTTLRWLPLLQPAILKSKLVITFSAASHKCIYIYTYIYIYIHMNSRWLPLLQHAILKSQLTPKLNMWNVYGADV